MHHNSFWGKKAATLECTLVPIFHKRNKTRILLKNKPTPYSLDLSHNEFWLLPKSNPPWGCGREHASYPKDFKKSSGQSHSNVDGLSTVASRGHHTHWLYSAMSLCFNVMIKKLVFSIPQNSSSPKTSTRVQPYYIISVCRTSGTKLSFVNFSLDWPLDPGLKSAHIAPGRKIGAKNMNWEDSIDKVSQSTSKIASLKRDSVITELKTKSPNWSATVVTVADQSFHWWVQFSLY